MLGSSARLLRLLSLLQARRFWSGAELAERLEITERTVRRDIDRLRSLGYPVNATAGVAGGYQLGAGATLPPLLLDDDEAMAVSIGLRTAAASVVTGIEESALRALSKLEQVMPARLARQMKALHTSIAPLHHKAAAVNAEVLTALSSACRNQQLAMFNYNDGKGASRLRNVEPHGLVHSGARWYLVAFDVDRADWRTFRVDRVDGKVAQQGRFLPRPIPEGDVAAYVSRSVSTKAYAFEARIVLKVPLEVAALRISPLAGRLTKLDAGTCLLEVGANVLSHLALHLAMLGFEFTVEEPPELVTELASMSARLTNAVAAWEATQR